ncbi:5'-nucleotidase C-terminal domain-containing protein [Thermoanaerobacterium sp. CMT5567-10]|uniref:5'-nucleotidase C-terminal domain-containing protein n=1 Tax=Thermoanaerobacterium sp. CMT5567-10 TaxID=3061989 RepID=UPI0024AC51C5|nr:5'-nucleotidase C-terminal domain-containing protein [Thermoanaerobacterium sp. CMT5567-10]MDI3529927.1 2,3-cyclic-nucleotide 2-phosphodiesterase / 3-nucleotidase / 5-nucleotidase [Thermoanaerobacter sp.]WKV09996.1 5'-nucleotidase C-terminal domain-containing protein [Thermoanaerobacterium sp. CMT5567-10]
MFRRSRITGIFVTALMIFSMFFTYIPQAVFAATPKTFDFVEVTDFHGYLQSAEKLSDGTAITQQIGGVLAKQIKDMKAANPNTVILSGGDMFQGTPMSNVLKGQPVIDMMKNIGFDAMALGNHEYDWGIDSVIDTQNATLKNSTIPVLAANVYDKTTGKPVSYTKPYVIIERDGVKIGIIGIVDNKEFPDIIMPAYIQNVDFKDPVPVVNQLATDLRGQGAQIVIVLAHMGANQDKTTDAITGNLIDFAKQVKGVDAIFGGHTHTIIKTKVNGIPVGVAGSYGNGFIDLKITLNADGTVTAGDMKYNNNIPLYQTANPVVDAEVQSIVDKANKDVGPIFNEVIGQAAIDLTRAQSAQPYGDSILGNWAAQVTKDAVGADFGFANNGGLRIDIPKGNITVGTIYQLMPFDNTIATMKMTGAQIKIVLEQAVQDGGKGIQVAGLSFKYDPSMPSMQRVFDMKKSDGTPIDMNASYLVATNNFMGTGGDGFKGFTDPDVAKSYIDTYKLVRDAFIEAVKNQKTVTAKIDNRIAPASQNLFGEMVPTPAPAPTPTPQYDYGIVTVSALNVRAGASTSSKVIGVLHAGNIVNLISESNGWYQIDYNGKTGYVYGKYVAVTSNLSNITVLKTVKVTARSGLNVRVNSSTAARKIGAVPYGAELKVVGEYNGWYQIQYNGGYGFVYAKYTK